jgi:hypothetical protein
MMTVLEMQGTVEECITFPRSVTQPDLRLTGFYLVGKIRLHPPGWALTPASIPPTKRFLHSVTKR